MKYKTVKSPIHYIPPINSLTPKRFLLALMCVLEKNKKESNFLVFFFFFSNYHSIPFEPPPQYVP